MNIFIKKHLMTFVLPVLLAIYILGAWFLESFHQSTLASSLGYILYRLTLISSIYRRDLKILKSALSEPGTLFLILSCCIFIDLLPKSLLLELAVLIGTLYLFLIYGIGKEVVNNAAEKPIVSKRVLAKLWLPSFLPVVLVNLPFVIMDADSGIAEYRVWVQILSIVSVPANLINAYYIPLRNKTKKILNVDVYTVFSVFSGFAALLCALLVLLLTDGRSGYADMPRYYSLSFIVLNSFLGPIGLEVLRRGEASLNYRISGVYCVAYVLLIVNYGHRMTFENVIALMLCIPLLVKLTLFGCKYMESRRANF